MSISNFTDQELIRSFSYDENTGDVISNHTGKPMRNVKASGGSKGYMYIGKFKEGRCKHIAAHHLAWLLYYSERIPEGKMIDHIDGDKTNNRISNLRLVDSRGNSWNLQSHRDGTTVPCIRPYANGIAFMVRVTHNGKKLEIPSHTTLESAIACRDQLLASSDPEAFCIQWRKEHEGRITRGKGVGFTKLQQGRWNVYIPLYGRSVYAGAYDTEEEANRVRLEGIDSPDRLEFLRNLPIVRKKPI